jgi:hypothetical protein
MRTVLSFTFGNPTAGSKKMLLAPGFKNYDRTFAPAQGVANDGAFTAIGGGTINGTGDANCTIKDFINFIMKNPTAMSGYKVSATALPEAGGVVNPAVADAQIQALAMNIVKQSISGDGKPQTLRPGLNIGNGDFRANQATIDQPFTLDDLTQLELTLLGFCQVQIDLYVNNTSSRGVQFERKHNIARQNISRMVGARKY